VWNKKSRDDESPAPLAYTWRPVARHGHLVSIRQGVLITDQRLVTFLQEQLVKRATGIESFALTRRAKLRPRGSTWFHPLEILDSKIAFVTGASRALSRGGGHVATACLRLGAIFLNQLRSRQDEALQTWRGIDTMAAR